MKAETVTFFRHSKEVPQHLAYIVVRAPLQGAYYYGQFPGVRLQRHY